MPSYAVDSMRQPMTATGIVDAMTEWEETPDGRRRPSDRQARHEQTGMPLWGVEVLYMRTAFGRHSTSTAKVTVGSLEQPTPSPLTPVAFAGLRVEARTSRSGGFTEYWTAEAMAEPQPRTVEPAEGGRTRPDPGKAA